MGIFSKLKEIFDFKSKKDKLKLEITCNNCSRKFDSVFRRSYDFQPAYGEEEYNYLLNKELVCPECYKSIYLNLELDKGLEILNQELKNGELKVKDFNADD